MNIMFLDDQGDKIETVQMPSIPRIGEVVKFTGVNQYPHPFRVIGVEYDIQGEVENLEYKWAHVIITECSDD